MKNIFICKSWSLIISFQLYNYNNFLQLITFFGLLTHSGTLVCNKLMNQYIHEMNLNKINFFNDSKLHNDDDFIYMYLFSIGIVYTYLYLVTYLQNICFYLYTLYIYMYITI